MRKEKGLTFIDVLVGISLMLIVFLGIFGAYQLGLKVVAQSKARITATALANQEMEMIRSLPYKEVGTTPHAIDEPSGTILQLSTTTQNNIEYTIEIKIIYINDCFDGPRSSECLAAPETDDCPRDYKRVTASVSWQKPGNGEVALVTDVAPKNINQEEEECTGQAAGVLSVSVFDALGLPVVSPLIELIDPETESLLASFQPFGGEHDFVLAPGNYKIKVSKINYSSSQTYQEGDIYQGEIIAEPLKAHSSVYEGQLTEVGFSVDQLSSMTIQTRGTRGQGYPPFHDVAFTMRGAKTVGNDLQGGPIYKYEQNHMTDGPAEIIISDLEWDSYSFYVDSPNYELSEIESPFEATTTQPIDLLPDTSVDVRLILKAENALLVIVQDASSTQPIFGAEVNLVNVDLDYDQTQPTSETGETLFIPLAGVSYDLTVRMTGFQDYLGTVFVSGDVTRIIDLTPSP